MPLLWKPISYVDANTTKAKLKRRIAFNFAKGKIAASGDTGWTFETKEELDSYIDSELLIMENNDILEFIELLSDDTWTSEVEAGNSNEIESTAAWMLKITDKPATDVISIATKAPNEEYTQEEVTLFFYQDNPSTSS